MTAVVWFIAGIVAAYVTSAAVVVPVIWLSWRRHCAEERAEPVHRVIVEGRTLDALAVGLRKAAAQLEAECVARSMEGYQSVPEELQP